MSTETSRTDTKRSGFRLTPGVVFLAIAVIGSIAFGFYTITVRDASQIPLLAAGAAACGIAFLALAAYALRATWRSGVEGRTGRAFGVAVGGGIAAMIGFAFVAGAIILFLLARST